MNLYHKDEVELNQVLFIKFMYNLYQLIILLANKRQVRTSGCKTL